MSLKMYMTVCSLLLLHKEYAQTTATIRSPQTELKQVNIGSTSLIYLEKGKGETIVLVHGSLSDYRTWQNQTEVLSRSYHVISYSRRYHYPNPWNDDAAEFSVLLHAQDLAAFLKTLNLGPVHLVGHSFGAAVALTCASMHPGLIRSLTLLEPPLLPLLKTSAEGDSLLGQFIQQTILPTLEYFNRNENQKAMAQFITGVMGDSTYWEKIPVAVRNIMLDNARELKAELLYKNVFPDLSPEVLSKLTMPVLLVTGEKSPLFLHLISDQIAHWLPQAKQIVVPNASHGIPFENPEFFNQALLKFLKPLRP